MKKIHLIWQIPLLLASIFAIFIGLYLIEDHKNFLTDYQTSIGEVIDVKRSNGSSNIGDSYGGVYEYYVEGEKYIYEQKVLQKKHLSLGDKREIYYDPMAPERAKLSLDDRSGPIVIVFAIVVALGALTLILYTVDSLPSIRKLSLGLLLVGFGFGIPITLKLYKLMIGTGAFGVLGIFNIIQGLRLLFGMDMDENEDDFSYTVTPRAEVLKEHYDEYDNYTHNNIPTENSINIVHEILKKNAEIKETSEDIEENIRFKYKDKKDGGKTILNLFRTLPDIIIYFSIPTVFLFIGLKDQNAVRRFMVTIAIILYIVMFFICLYRFLNRQFNLGKTKAVIVFKLLGGIIPILIFCLVFILIGVHSVLKYIDDKDFAANCVETKGEVVNATKEYDYSDEKYYYLTEVTYFVNATKYTAKYYYSKELKAGDEVTVYYLEESPNESNLSKVVYPPSGAFACIVALLMGAYGFYLVFKQLRDYKERQAMYEDPFEE